MDGRDGILPLKSFIDIDAPPVTSNQRQMHQISRIKDPNEVSNTALNQEQLFHKAMHYFRNGIIFADLYAEKYMGKGIGPETIPMNRSLPPKNPPPFLPGASKQSKEPSKTRPDPDTSINMNQLKVEVEGLGNRIENGKSSSGFMVLGLSALGIWGLGMLTYAAVKMAKNAVRWTQGSKIKEWNTILNERTLEDEVSVDRRKLLDKGKERLHARDIKLCFP